MKTLLVLLALIVVLGCNRPHEGGRGHSHSHTDMMAHDGHQKYQVSTPTLHVQTDSPIHAGIPVTLTLMIHSMDGKMVSDFATVHGEKVHLIVVREGLDEFAHLHPVIAPSGTMSVVHTFPVAGTYRLFADYQQPGSHPTTAVGKVVVTGEGATAAALIADVPGEIQRDGLRATVAITPGRSNTSQVSFRIRDAQSRPVTDLEPYMDALGHLVLVSADATRYVHVHPVGGDRTTGTVVFEAHFPAEGVYKGWVQFRRNDRVHTLPMVFSIKD